MSTGAVVGIGIGATVGALLLVGAVLGYSKACFIFHAKTRKNHKFAMAVAQKLGLAYYNYESGRGKEFADLIDGVDKAIIEGLEKKSLKSFTTLDNPHKGNAERAFAAALASTATIKQKCCVGKIIPGEMSEIKIKMIAYLNENKKSQEDPLRLDNASSDINDFKIGFFRLESDHTAETPVASETSKAPALAVVEKKKKHSSSKDLQKIVKYQKTLEGKEKPEGEEQQVELIEIRDVPSGKSLNGNKEKEIQPARLKRVN